jgi:hypothetical protein
MDAAADWGWGKVGGGEERERERERECVCVCEQATVKYSLRDTEWGRRPSDSCLRQCSKPLVRTLPTALRHTFQWT